MNMANDQVKLSVANFKPGSFIAIENNKANDCFFIIRQGRVKLTKSINSLLGESDTILGPGDFFGVIEAMTGHPRIETSIAVSDVSVIICKKNQFGFLIQKNAPLAMKIIRSFSNILRHFDIELAKRTSEGKHDEENPNNLYYVGEYYFKIKAYKIAVYIFIRYINLFPNGDFVDKAKDFITSMSNVEITNKLDSNEFNRVYKDGEMLFSEYESGNELFIIQSGKVKITKVVNDRELIIAVIKPGDIFGEMALLNDKNRVAGAIAFGDVSVMAVSRLNFSKIVFQNAAIATKLITLLSDRIWTIYRQLGTLLLSDPLSRAYDTLLTHVMKNHVPIDSRKSYHFNFGLDELFKMLGLDREKDKYVIDEMLSNPFVSIEANTIRCDDVSGLKKEIDIARRMREREIKREQSKN